MQRAKTHTGSGASEFFTDDDSIFDNGAYVRPGEPDVVRQVRALLPTGWRAALCAVDGSVTASIERQIESVPRDTTHLIVSVGGNDALQYVSVFQEAVNSVGAAVRTLSEIRAQFAQRYKVMLDRVVALRFPVTLCTIYDGRFPDPQEQRLVVTGLAIFNDVITRECFARRLTLIDLRLICSEEDDYANTVEPSAKGGQKIAEAIAQATGGNTIFPRSQVFAH